MASLLDQYRALFAAQQEQQSPSPSLVGSSNEEPALILPETVPSFHAAQTPVAASAFTRFATADIQENQRWIRILVDLPGVARQDLQVEVQRSVLLIQGIRTTAFVEFDDDSNHRWRQQHKFCRRFALDTRVVEASKLRANFNTSSGVLVIVAPKKQLQQNQEDMQGEAVPETTTAAAENTQVSAMVLPNVVSMGSAEDALEEAATTTRQKKAAKKNHKSTLPSHLMIRRSMRMRTRNQSPKKSFLA